MQHYNMLREDSFEQISGLYARPRTKRQLINGPFDYKLIEVRPDLTITMKDATLASKRNRIGFGFTEGKIPKLFNYKDATQKLLDDHIPVLISKIRKGNLEFEQLAFTGEARESRKIYIRMHVKNLHPCTNQQIMLWFTIIQKEHSEMYEFGNEDYLPYNPVKEIWLDGVLLTHQGQSLIKDESVVMSYSVEPGMSVEYVKQNNYVSNIMKFTAELLPNEIKTIDIVIPYEGLDYIEPEDGQEEAINIRLKKRFSFEQIEAFHSESFDKVLESTVSQWKVLIKKSTRIEVPEYIVQRIYNTLTLNNLQLLAHPPEKEYYIAGQGGFSDFCIVYGWESSFMLIAMDSQGYHTEVRKVLDYYLSIQDSSKGPEGDIHSTVGTFRPFISWMCETGAIMHIFGSHYKLTNDKDWFLKVAPRLIKACNWICNERKSTKQFNDAGIPVNHFGLLPAGKVHDWPDKGYFFFSDVYTYQGFKIISEALVDIGHQDGERMLEESEDYRVCIENAIKKATYPHPMDKDNIFIANEVYTTPERIMTSYGGDGPACLLSTGLIKPEDDRVPHIELGLRQLGFMDDIFAFKLPEMEDIEIEKLLLNESCGRYELYYVNSAENIWHKVWLERGEIQKALRYFYSTLAYSTTLDTSQCNERFCPQIPWFVPWQPNASGNGRIIEMIHRTLFYEKDGHLNILIGSPTIWLKPGNVIKVERGHTILGELSFSAECQKNNVDERYFNIDFNFNLSNHEEVKGMRIAVRTAYDGKLLKAIVYENGCEKSEKVVIEDNFIVINAPGNIFDVKCIWDTTSN